MLNRVCVYCGSNKGSRPDYLEAARNLGFELAKNQITLVYGGGNVGMMGELANSTLEAGGKVIGVIPSFFYELGVVHDHLTEIHIVETMHERKSMMEKISDGFITLPGGLGTLDELFEILTWAQLGIHEKPCGLLNICNYYSKLVQFLENCVQEKYLNPTHLQMLIVGDEPSQVLEQFRQYEAPKVSKLLN